jgi:hypothetical protein
MPDDIMSKSFISREEAQEYLRTPEGRRAFAIWIHREKCARAIAKLLIEFGLDLPPKEEQERLAHLLFQWTSPATPVWDVMVELGHAEEILRKFAMESSVSQLCDTEEPEVWN